MFFRARVEAPDEVPAAVTPETDANLSVEGMADELGGELTVV